MRWSHSLQYNSALGSSRHYRNLALWSQVGHGNPSPHYTLIAPLLLSSGASYVLQPLSAAVAPRGGDMQFSYRNFAVGPW